MKNSAIEWTDHTFNPWIGCTKVSPGCAHCYAEARDKRFTGGKHWGKGAPRQRTIASNWKQPLKWNAQPRMEFERRPRVFCASLADWLDDEVPIEWTIDLLDLIRVTTYLDWQLLTKRPENWSPRMKAVMDHLSNNGAPDAQDDLWNWIVRWSCGKPLKNVWIGTTVEDQKRADERIPELLKIPSKVHFLSCEPLLGSIDLSGFQPFTYAAKSGVEKYIGIFKPTIDWVICGGESGPHARPMHYDWARSLRDQCQVASVPFFFKQWGEWQRGSTLGRKPEIEAVMLNDGRLIQPCTLEKMLAADRESSVAKCNPDSMARVGKHAAGRLLDGREWNEFPRVEVAP